MKNTTLILVAALVLVAGGMGIFALINRDTALTKSESMEKIEVRVKDENAEIAKTDESMMQKKGTYAPFTPELLANSASTRRVLFFYANWCPTCKPADTSFTKNLVQIPADVTLIRVNYNDTETDQAEKDLAKKYGVTYQHTYVQIDAKGNEVTKWNGGQIDELLSNIK